LDDLGPKQVRYPGYHELAYLHPNRFTPNPEVLKEIGLTENDKFFVVRFVSWEASHDIGQKGLSLEDKRKLIDTLKPYGKIIITSEKPLPEEFEEYKMRICPTKMHDLLYYATLLYGESATMSSECAVLGTHSFFIYFAGLGNTDEQEKKYNLVYNYKTDRESINSSFERLNELLQIDNLKELGRMKREILLKDKIDVTQFLIDLIENESTTNSSGLSKRLDR
jgi:predicted glycosyltransferase